MSWRENELINKAYLSLGSNLGDREDNIKKAIELLSERAGQVVSISKNYETKPDGFISENNFINMALCLETSLNALQLLDLCEEIEKIIGRERKSINLNYSDRVIDVDILYFNSEQIASERLILPHPRLHKRQFVLEPLAEIAPKLKHPILGINTEKMLKQIKC